MKQRHIISALVENHSGVLARVSTLISGRGFNIDSLTVGETHDPSVSRMTIVTVGDDRVCEQMVKQLDKLVDVIKVEDIKDEEIIDRELMLLKVSASGSAERSDVMQIANTFRAKIVDVNSKHLTVEVTGTESKVDAMIELLEPFGILEVVRTGLVAIARRSTMQVPGKPVLRTRTFSSAEELEKALPVSLRASGGSKKRSPKASK